MTTNRIACASFLLLLSPSCADAPTETVGVAVQAELSSGRTVASPIVRVYDETTGTYISPVNPVTLKRRSAWDGSYAEMLAADEYVKCVSEVVGLNPTLPNGAVLQHPEMSDNYSSDSAMSRIQGFITQGSCARKAYGIDSTTKEPIFPTAVLEWAYRRKDPECNRQNLDEVPIAAIELPVTDTGSNAPMANFLTNLFKVNFSYIPVATPTIDRAFDFLYRANVNLCFAKRLNQMLEESETFTTTTQEHLLLLGLAHERAQDSMMRLGHLLKLAARPIEETPVKNYSGYAEGALLRQWLEYKVGSDQVNVTRESFLSALRLTNVTSTTLATYLERQAGARWTTVSGAGAFLRDWGPGSARSRLLNLVYGGGVLTDLWGASDWLSYSPKWFTEVSSASPNPQVTVLMNLARHNDALFIRSIPGTSPPELDPASAEAVYTETELGLRVRECTNTDTAQCTKAVLRSSLPPVSSESEYLLYRYYRVTLEHATSLVGSLFDGAVRHDLLAGGSQTHGSFHLTGTHVSQPPSGNSGLTDGWIKLDPNTELVPYLYADRALFGESIKSPFTPAWDFFGGGSSGSGTVGPANQTGKVGVVAALAFAREVLFQETETGRVTDANIAADISDGLNELERLLGKRTVIVRPASIDMIEPADSRAVQLTRPVVPAAQPGLRTAAIDNGFVGPNGVKRSSLDAANRVDPARQTTTATLRRVSWDYGNGTEDTSSLLRWGTENGGSYLFLGVNDAERYQDDESGTIVEDGWFADLIQRVTAVQETDWSRPRYDGFGLPSRWVPPADASLMGGNAGEESYQYLLRSAKTAAEEATSAVKTAIDNLVTEAQDDAALQQAETKASAISSLETTALCGTAEGCRLDRVTYQFGLIDETKVCDEAAANAKTACVNIFKPGVPDVVFDAFIAKGRTKCISTLRAYKWYLPTLQIPTAVSDALSTINANAFSTNGWGGSELQRVLVRIWNAAQLVKDARFQAGKIAVASGTEQAAAAAGAEAARFAYISTVANIQDVLTEKAGASALQLAQIQGNVDTAETIYETEESKMYSLCTDDDDTWTQCFVQDSVVRGAKKQLEIASSIADDAYLLLAPDGSNAKVAAQTAVDAKTAALYQLSAARAQSMTQVAQAAVQMGSHVAIIQQTVGELNSALAELDQLVLRAGQVEARAVLEKSLAQSTYGTNANLRRKYRSYDMWRARALLESGRKLAVAARRSIEARFVVDLSTLSGDQAFVASPSTWADEVYESDLNAPEVVGLSQTPKIEGAIYPNKLLDYVGNLERFVQGYTITYPTSVSLPDTEVLSFGGPDQVRGVAGTNTEELSSDSLGWVFYCPASDKWISHPGTGEYPISNRLATACGGSQPTLAKIGFKLDPWGTLNGSWARPQFEDRHNVRWRRLAVNLVGTGIRDCSKSTDSMSCYTNPYIRFNMIHAGPSWQTNYALDWRALDIPIAHIEAGKALAAEEWLEPITNSWNTAYVSNVARGELFGRPAAGSYEVVLEITPDVRLDRIERVQMLVEQDYWVRQNGGRGVYGNSGNNATTGVGGSTGAGGAASTGGASSTGGTTGSGGMTSSSTTTVVNYTGTCAPNGSDSLIDNFEHQTRVVPVHEGRLGLWFGFNAGNCSSSSPPTNDAFLPSAPGAGDSALGGIVNGIGCNDPWVGGGLGLLFLSNWSNGAETPCTTYDASKYTGVTFQARGVGTLRFEVATTQNTTQNFAGYDFAVSDVWAWHTIRWSQLAQDLSWGNVMTDPPLKPAQIWKMQWLMKSTDYSFSIDNISFISN